MNNFAWLLQNWDIVTLIITNIGALLAPSPIKNKGDK
jgi:hypothetical protein